MNVRIRHSCWTFAIAWAVVLWPTQLLAQAARITGINPVAAKPGEIVTIDGNGFGAANVRITVQDVPATITKATGSRASFIVPALAPGRVVVRATNPGGRTGSIDFQVLAAAIVDGAAAVQSIVGPKGGVVRTVSQGVELTLSVPVAALESDTTITLTPLRALPGLPFSGGLVAGARLAPDGLRFNRPATLILANLPPLPPDPAGAPRGLIGFTSGESGGPVEVLPSLLLDNTIYIPIAHFSDAGAADAAIADFERTVRPIVDSLPANVSPQAVASLLGQLQGWMDRFGFQLCVQTDLCKIIFDRGLAALAAELEAALGRFEAHIAAGEPFLARDDLGTVVKLVQHLQEIAYLAARADNPDYQPSFDLSDLSTAFDEIIALAKTQALEQPRVGLLVLFTDVASDAALSGLQGVDISALAALLDVLEDILRDADEACATDPPRGEAMLDMVPEAFHKDFLNSLQAGLALRFETARTTCPIRVSPSPASVAMFEEIQLAGTAVGYSPDTVSWSIDGFAGGSTISASGLFKAGNASGTVTVVARSVADAERYRRVAVEVVPIEVEVTPPTATIDAGQTLAFTASVRGPRNTGVRWSATGGSIDPATGVFTSNVVGSFTVRATSLVDSGFFGEATVTVRERAVGQGRVVHRTQASFHRCAGCNAEFTDVVDDNREYVWDLRAEAGPNGTMNVTGTVAISIYQFLSVLGDSFTCQGMATVAVENDPSVPASRWDPAPILGLLSAEVTIPCPEFGSTLRFRTRLYFDAAQDTVERSGGSAAAIVWSRSQSLTNVTPGIGTEANSSSVVGRLAR